MRKAKYKVGDVVFLKADVLSVNWTLKDSLNTAFVITESHEMKHRESWYNVHPLHDDKNIEQWNKLLLYEDFIEVRG